MLVDSIMLLVDSTMLLVDSVILVVDCVILVVDCVTLEAELYVTALITEVVLVNEVSVLLLIPLNTAVKLTVHALSGSIKWIVIIVTAPLDIMLVDPVGGCELFPNNWHEWEIV